jgi:hypothetical protein
MEHGAANRTGSYSIFSRRPLILALSMIVHFPNGKRLVDALSTKEMGQCLTQKNSKSWF